MLLSGSRADLGYLLPVADALRAAGAHAVVESLQEIIGGEDTPQAIASRAGAVLAAGGKTLFDNRPDMLIVLGDRWEIASACLAASLADVPIAHIGAGERTNGSYDNRFRASIEALASKRFALTETAFGYISRRYPLQNDLAGCTSVTPPATIADGDGTAIVILHPETAGEKLTPGLADAISEMCEIRDLKPVLLGSNPDVGSSAFPGGSMPLDEFHARLESASLIIGNSSAGIIEAPILCTPSVNIGRRQEGRPCAASVFQASADVSSINTAIIAALAFGKQRVVSPYWNPNAIQTIARECLEYLRDR
jgi:hypothetical protein